MTLLSSGIVDTVAVYDEYPAPLVLSLALAIEVC